MGNLLVRDAERLGIAGIRVPYDELPPRTDAAKASFNKRFCDRWRWRRWVSRPAWRGSSCPSVSACGTFRVPDREPFQRRSSA